ncbi:DegT/DnrJ/EryC1/StrS family aminotransferase [Gracilinema caldarium]|uniref:DegT/DnrJ/EryC1/StrS aminotransferase n=1 Tax=Gracilinema caldarium (strain ATCC 51460 / DSM 7334 / H1) TaxID=744872 RepID=F8EXL2_GRAC1|nr:DegT/DnrJ/EryC1/StrS aminotransferase family protein [Gracilinema caldarium]AEJ19593.1 DegT/DnrJ/EryC1/StrS aminotransferase [Gracilinema caldarium DSM 7334]
MNKTIEPIPFARPFIGAEEEAAVLRVLRSGWLTTGSEALQFEKEFADFFRRNTTTNPAPAMSAYQDLTALAVNSATSGLHLALEACGVGPGDIVITSTYTFTATAEVVRYLGAHVVFVDVAPNSYLMDVQALEQTFERLARGRPAYPPRPGTNDPEEGFGPRGQVKAIIPVHVAGLSCDMDAIMNLARTYNARVIEDAAHAFPSQLADGRWVGLLGDIGVFSFYATKTITTGEGGMILTRDKTIARRISIMRSHGIDRSIWNRYTDTRASWKYAVVAPGYKYNLPDVLAALGRVQLSRAMELLEMRRAIAHTYTQAFRSTHGLLLPPTGPENAWHLYPIRLAGSWGKTVRNQFIEHLQALGIGVSVHFIPLHTMPYYRSLYNLDEQDFPQALDIFSRSISIPIWPGMTREQIQRVVDGVVETVKILKG